MEQVVGVLKTFVGVFSLICPRRTLLNPVDIWKGHCGTNAYLCMSVSVCVCLSVHICGACDSLHFSPEWMLLCLLMSVLKLPKGGPVPHIPLCYLWLISPLESWEAVHLVERNLTPQNDFL